MVTEMVEKPFINPRRETIVPNDDIRISLSYRKGCGEAFIRLYSEPQESLLFIN